MLRTHPSFPRAGVAVGIFESAISSALTLLPFPHELTKRSSGGETEGKFGIVTTGAPWIPVLTASTNQYLGLPATEEKSESSKFSGVESTGLNADELHTAPPEEVHRRMVGATRRLVRGGHTKVIILGCAGMAGMDDMVKEGCESELGREGAKGVRIVDGVKAALAVVDGFVRSQS
jgi:Asp/Glu/hydantoin racemase